MKIHTSLDRHIKDVMQKANTEMLHILSSLPTGDYLITEKAYHGIISHPSFKLDWLAKKDIQKGYDIAEVRYNSCGQPYQLNPLLGSCFKKVDTENSMFILLNGTKITADMSKAYSFKLMEGNCEAAYTEDAA